MKDQPRLFSVCVREGDSIQLYFFLPELMYYLPAPFHLRPHAGLSLRCIIKMTGQLPVQLLRQSQRIGPLRPSGAHSFCQTMEYEHTSWACSLSQFMEYEHTSWARSLVRLWSTSILPEPVVLVKLWSTSTLPEPVVLVRLFCTILLYMYCILYMGHKRLGIYILTASHWL